MTDVRDWIHYHAQRRPTALAQVDFATKRRFTYAQMQERVSALAGYLSLDLGIAEGEVVAVLGNNSSDTFDIDFACGRIGALFLPLNTRLSAVELAYQLDDAQPRAIFYGAGFEDLLTQALAITTSVIPPCLIAFAGAAGEREMESLLAAQVHRIDRREQLASCGWTLIYSSGTTGRPKGILHTHGGVTQQAISNCVPLGLSPRSCALGVIPLFHISGLNVFGHAMFYAGGTQVTLPGFDPRTVLAAMSDDELAVTHFAGVPTMFEMMASLPEFEGFRPAAIEGVFVGGSPSTEALLRTYAEKGVPLIQGYGLTETGPVLTILNADEAVARLGSVGKPIMHVDLRIERGDGSDASAGEIGEVIVRGPSVITEYFRAPEHTADDFVDGWLRTGDMGYLDADGYLFLADRKKDMYISGGENVCPAEVENCIAAHDAVASVAVVGMRDEKWGEVGVACVVLKPDRTASESDIRSICEQRLARYKIPRHVVFRTELPLGGSGKVLKARIREQLPDWL